MTIVSRPSADHVPHVGKWIDRAILANLVLGFGFAASFVFFAWRARFPIPYMDDWDWLASFRNPGSFARQLWQLHNEHLLVVPKLLVWLDFRLWGWPGYLTLIAGVLSHVVVAAVLIDSAVRRLDRSTARLLTGTTLVLLFLTYQLQGLVFPASVMFPLVTAFSAAAIWLLGRAGAARGGSARRSLVGLSAAACALAMLTMTNGLFLPFLLAGLALPMGQSRRTCIGFTLLGVAGGCLRYAIGGMPPSAFISSPVSVALFAVAFLGGFIASVSGPLAVAVGGLSLLLAARCIWNALTRPDRDVMSDWTLIGVLIFGLASAALAAPSRATFGLNNAAQSRYVILVCAYWTALLVLSAPRGRLRGHRGTAIAVALTALTFAAVPAQILVGLVWAAKRDHLMTAGLSLATGVWDDEWTWRIHILGSTAIRPGLEVLSSRHASTIQFEEGGRPSANATVSAPACHGAIEASDPNLVAQPSTGLRIAGGLRERGERLLISDAAAQVRGLAREAPLVPYARAYANDFVWAVVGDVVRPADRSVQRWQGFSTRGSGAPYSAELMDAEGRLVCRVTVVCCMAPPIEAPLPILIGADEHHR